MTQSLARKLRPRPTEAEVRMWRLLHPFRTGGYHFRKQVALGPYIADFVCHHAKLVIEVDGGQHFHEAGRARDKQRDDYLRQRGYSVFRFSNRDVLGNPDGVYMQLQEHLDKILPRIRRSVR